MKATTILKLIERALNPDLKEAHIKAYAKDQIEKDREDLIKENKLTNNGMIAYKIRNRPIILD